MRKEIIIRIHVNSDTCQSKAMKVAAAVSGVESVTLAGGDKSLLLVIGDGVDSNKLTKKLKKKVGEAEIVELRTLADAFEGALPLPQGAAAAGVPGSKGARSPYINNHQWQYSYATAPSPYAYNYYGHYDDPSPMGGAGGGYGYGYGDGASGYSRAVARSHPANYSPLVEKHDYQAMDHYSSSSGRKSKAVARRHESDTNRCAIL